MDSYRVKTLVTIEVWDKNHSYGGAYRPISNIEKAYTKDMELDELQSSIRSNLRDMRNETILNLQEIEDRNNDKSLESDK